MARRPTKGGGGDFTPAQKRAYTRELKRRLAKGQSEDYARRQARGKAQGKTQQQARGHREGEARERREYQQKHGLLSYSQKQTIRRFARRQTDRMNTDPHADLIDEEETANQFLEWASRQGWDAFIRFREQVRKLAAQKRKRTRIRIFRGKQGERLVDLRVDVSGRSASRGLMEQLAEDWKLGEWRWLFYH